MQILILYYSQGGNTEKLAQSVFSILQCMLIYGMIIVGDPMSASGHYGVACVGRPDEGAVSDAFKLGARVGELCKKLHGLK